MVVPTPDGAIMEKRRSTTKAKTPKKAGPWDKDNPKKVGEHRHLSPQAKAAAKRRAKAAGRPYPNLVDNMHAAAASKK
jgi:hypothetical protein